MITEDYVSFEIAKLLKEKRFDEGCCSYYTKANKNIKPSMVTNPANHNSNNFLLSRPTLQMAMKWLREVHFLFIDIDPLTGYKWSWSIWFMNDSTQKMGESLEIFSTYKEAAEAAIKYCLTNLI